MRLIIITLCAIFCLSSLTVSAETKRAKNLKISGLICFEVVRASDNKSALTLMSRIFKSPINGDWVINYKTSDLYKRLNGTWVRITRQCLEPGLCGISSSTGSMFKWNGSKWQITSSANVVNVRDYGAVGDSITDDTDAIQEALDIAGSNSRNNLNLSAPTKTPLMGKVYIPAGRYLVTRTINLTTGFKKGSDRKNMDIFYHAHTTIEGAGWHATQILGLTRKPGRTDGVVFDCAGSGLITMRDLMITTPKGAWTVDEPYASTMAIFLGRASTDINESTGWYCGEVLLDRIHIKLPSIPEANGNIGTIGIWNNGAESQSYNNINVWANLPVMLSFDRQPPGLPRDMKFESDYVDLAPTGVSTKLTTISGSTTLWAWDNLRPALYMQGEIEVTVNQPSYFARCMSGIPNEKKGNYYFAIEAWFVDHFKHEGDMENFAQYMKVPMFIRNADIKVGIGARYINPGTVLSQLPLIDMTPPENATQPSGFQNANINIGLPIDQEADRAPERIFYVADSATPRLNAKTADPRLPTVVLFQNVKVVGTRGGEHPDAQFASPNLVPYMRFYDFYDYMGNVRIKGD